jgi:hypothetical protein
MLSFRYSLQCRVLAVCAVLLLCACSSQQQKLAVQDEDRVDFSGSWELDYGQSDNVQARLNSLVRELRQQAERRANMNQQGGAAIGGTGSNSGEAIIGLARMAELITQSQLLEIEQDEHNIKVKREENFALTCEFYPGQFHTVETPLGSEVCGWSGHQLVFRILLPEGLNIQHLMTMGPEGERLHIATTVLSSKVSYPFTVNRVYNRFDPGNSGIRCEMTVTRGRVCTTEAR